MMKLSLWAEVTLISIVLHGRHLILKPGQNRLVKKLVETQGHSPKNHECQGKTSSDGQPV